MHGASLGELTAARPLLAHLLEQHANLQVIVTANTYSGRDMVQGWNDPRIQARLAPLDSPWIMRRFLNRWQPAIAFTLENELWPMRMLACKNRNIPVVVVGARLSKKSAAMWHRFGRLARKALGAITALAPLDQENGARIAGLGVPLAKIGAPVNLKPAVRLTPPPADTLKRYANLFERENTILAASTHVGEDEIMLDAFQTARRTQPELRLILAPRHPERADSIARLLNSRKLGYCRRSETPEPNINKPVYIADTIGEMPLWYSLSFLTIVGGSFVNKGGHTPVEPVQFCSLVVHGPDTSNHHAPFQALTDNGAAFSATSAPDLAGLIMRLHQDKNRRKIHMRARAALDQLGMANHDMAALMSKLNDLSGGAIEKSLLD